MNASRPSVDLAIITARGGSKGLPGKNVMPLGGLPLIAWTIAAARESEVFSRIIVSTDDEEIAVAAREAGAEVPFVRPAQLASDTASSADVVAHVLQACPEAQAFALLQPTSPFRTAAHLRAAAARFAEAGVRAVVGVVGAKPPSWTFAIDADGAMAPAIDSPSATRRQGAHVLVQPNGSMYFVTRGVFEESGTLMPPGSIPFMMNALASIDIDGPEDMWLAKALVAAGYPQVAP